MRAAVDFIEAALAGEAKMVNRYGTEFHAGDPVSWDTLTSDEEGDWTEEAEWESFGVILDLGTDRSDTAMVMEIKRTLDLDSEYTKWIGQPVEVHLDLLGYVMVIV